MKQHLITAGQAFLAVLLFVQLGLTSYVTSLETSPDGYKPPKSILFTLGSTVWSILALAFISITPLVLSYAFHNLVALFLLASTSIVWLGGSIAIASILGDLLESWKHVYALSQPIVAFSFFIWATFAALMSLEVVGLLKVAYRSGPQEIIEFQDVDEHAARYGFR
ncbi:hypothetical protein QQS21_012428 [Conoideocrella luteorostrata]|uniref:MARVEL domain-containing protein n=1 Tax=Conoideocrella luteorostrata TaxID=1105319 RepID=A0AAJ0FSP7_9HYPO|nr:hypothetical protein QQS21_012428 [Conoideocrella luteorostrata]